MIRTLTAILLMIGCAQLQMAASEPSSACAGSTPIALSFTQGIPTLKVEIDGIQIEAIVDTGSPVSLADETFVQATGDGSDAGAFATYYGDMATQDGRLKPIRIGDSLIEDMPVQTIVKGGGAFAELVRGRLVLGRAFLSNHDMIFDGPNGRAYIRPAQNPRDRTEFAYSIEYRTGQATGLCLFDSGFGASETMFIHRDAPILAEQTAFQSLGRIAHGASASGQADLVSVFVSLAGGRTRSILAALEVATDIGTSEPGLGYCLITSQIMQDHRIILRSGRRLVTLVPTE